MGSNIKIRLPVAVATALLLSSLGGAASAVADDGVRWERVKFADINVNSLEGLHSLYGRIHAAAERVCAETDPTLRQAANACINKAERGAVEKVNLPQLTAYYKSADHTLRLAAAR